MTSSSGWSTGLGQPLQLVGCNFDADIAGVSVCGHNEGFGVAVLVLTWPACDCSWRCAPARKPSTPPLVEVHRRQTCPEAPSSGRTSHPPGWIVIDPKPPQCLL